MHPAHEAGVHIAGGVGQDIVHEFTMNGGQVGGRFGKIAAERARTSSGIGCQTGRSRMFST
jgi:hypothetical protein